MERKRRQRGGRRGAATPASIAKPAAPYIKRGIPCLEILDEEGLAFIEQRADQVLEEIGIEFRGDRETLKILADAGASVDGERVRFEPGMLRRIIQLPTPIPRNSGKKPAAWMRPTAPISCGNRC